MIDRLHYGYLVGKDGYPLRFLWRALVIILLVIFIKGASSSEPSAYINSPESRTWVRRVEWEVHRIQRAAQDLPASIEVVIRRLMKDIKPHLEAKSV